MSPATGGGPVVCDLRAIQSPDHRGRGVGRWSYEMALGIERVRPDLVGAYLLDASWPPPGAIDELLQSRKVVYGGTREAAIALDRAGAYHCFSPFEPSLGPASLRPEVVDRRGLSYSVVGYDLIPLRHEDEYLSDLAARRSYTAKLELLRGADAVLAISEAVADDLVDLLGLASSRCHGVGTGVSRHFVPPVDRVAVRREAAQLLGFEGPFLLFPAGSEGRKNTETLIDAFAGLSGDFPDHRLVITGELPALTANHYRHMARLNGAGERLVLTGFVSDESLLLLYQSSELVVFPSLAEGYGLPIAEAVACGTPAAVSDRRPFSDLVPESAARFDPEDGRSISRVVARLLAEPALRDKALEAARHQVTSWDEVASRAGEVFDSLLDKRRPRQRPRRRSPRLALVSPLPRLLTGVADYSGKLVRALERLGAEGGFELDCFADGLDRYPIGEEALAEFGAKDARTFRAHDAVNAYDKVLYVLGNSDCHASALASLRSRPGLVMTHDVRLSGLLTLSAEMPGAVPGGLAGAIGRSYGSGLPAGLGESGSLSRAEQDRYGLLLLREVALVADRILVSSDSARELATIDLGPELSDRLGVLPFAMSRLEKADLEIVSKEREGGKARPLVASFGILDESKRPQVLVRAVAALAEGGRAVDLFFVGLSSEANSDAVLAEAYRHGIANLVHVEREASRDEYVAALGRADIAVQLRERFSGEASGTVSECLSAGLPTIVSDIGWMSELPSSGVRKVAADCGPAELAAAILELLSEPGRAANVGREGQSFAAGRTFDAVAVALLGELGL